MGKTKMKGGGNPSVFVYSAKKKKTHTLLWLELGGMHVRSHRSVATQALLCSFETYMDPRLPVCMCACTRACVRVKLQAGLRHRTSAALLCNPVMTPCFPCSNGC